MPRLAWLELLPALAVAIVLGWPASDAAAQTQTLEAPAHISLVDGAAVLERDGRAETAPTSMPLLAGDRIRTETGRVEVLYADGSTLHLDARTVVDFQSDEVIRLLEGRLRLSIPGPSRQVAYRIDAPAAWVLIHEPGEFRVSLIPGDRQPELELAVLRGSAEVVNENGRTALRAGERAFARAGAAPSYAYVFNSAAWDAFDQWSEARRTERLGASAEYLPAQVRPYAATLASYGTWRDEPTYGYVWYPTVPLTWRPYYYGRWKVLRPYGWTWIGTDPWAWPTHHYGRWGFSAGLWFWIPGTHWGPAWVSWAYAPGYVSWCPLGWNNRAVFHFSVNWFGGRRYDPWYGWTVVPHGRFGSGFVHTNVVRAAHIDVRARGSFVIRDGSPEVRGVAVPRSGAPIRAAGTRNGVAATRSGIAVPRGGGSVPGPGRIVESPRNAATDSRAVLRNGRTTAEPPARGFPAPARDPRSPASVRQAVPRGAPRASGDATRQTVTPRGGSEAPAATSDRGAVRRAVPRSAPGAVPVPRTASPQPQSDPRRGVQPGRPESNSAPAGRAAPESGSAPRIQPGTPAIRRVPSVEYYRGPA
ncbi:MAG TPA: DUF6600 domain-containing protein, partial [Vicinamibacterales bacterium]|nr:DUF6600 domain-containing protein [Vicinamibacterales bacterium]